MVDGKYDRAKARDIFSADNVNVAKEDTQNGMKEYLDRKVKEGLHLTDERVAHENGSEACDVPWGDGWKHMKKNLDWIDPVKVEEN